MLKQYRCNICGKIVEVEGELDPTYCQYCYGNLAKKYEVLRLSNYKINPPIKHTLKPWKDTESLFCDTDFLEKIIKKPPAKGEECKN